MNGGLPAFVAVPAHDASGPGAVLVVAGACIWMLSLLIGWMMPVPLIASLARVTLTASAASVLVLLVGLVLLLAAAAG